MIPRIPQNPPPAQAPALWTPESDPDGYPKRSVCTYCAEVIAQAAKDSPWEVGNLLGGGGRECHKAPNPEDGPMPDHAPGTVLHPPKR